MGKVGLQQLKEEVVFGTQSADGISITDSTGKFVAVDVENALKEVMDKANSAFQSANDGKTSVSSAITAKGVTASPADTFPILATKIGQINTGKRFRTGVVQYGDLSPAVNHIGTSSNTLISKQQIIVNDLDFEPSIVLFYTISHQSSAYTTAYIAGSHPNVRSVKLSRYDTSEYITRTYHFRADTSLCYVNSTGFRLPVYGTVTHIWFAFE